MDGVRRIEFALRWFTVMNVKRKSGSIFSTNSNRPQWSLVADIAGYRNTRLTRRHKISKWYNVGAIIDYSSNDDHVLTKACQLKVYTNNPTSYKWLYAVYKAWLLGLNWSRLTVLWGCLRTKYGLRWKWPSCCEVPFQSTAQTSWPLSCDDSIWTVHNCYNRVGTEDYLQT